MNWEFIRVVGPARWVWRTARRQIDKRVLRRDTRLRLPTGPRIVLPRMSKSASEVFVTNADIDWGTEALFARFADPSADMFDIGAHIGYYSLYLSPLVRRVYAFEPDRRNYAGLRANAAVGGNIEHVEKAVSDKSGVVHFAVGSDSAIGRVSEKGVEVPATSVDDFVAESGAVPKLIKIDVEGHDIVVVEGARDTLVRLEPLVNLEFQQSDYGANDASRLFDLAESVGYAIYAFSPYGKGRSLKRLIRGDVGRLETKMLLMVPPRLARDFADLAQAGSPAGS